MTERFQRAAAPYGKHATPQQISSTSRALDRFAETFEGFVVDGELAFLLQAVNERGAERIEGCVLLGLKQLLLDVVLLFGEILGLGLVVRGRL